MPPPRQIPPRRRKFVILYAIVLLKVLVSLYLVSVSVVGHSILSSEMSRLQRFETSLLESVEGIKEKCEIMEQSVKGAAKKKKNRKLAKCKKSLSKQEKRLHYFWDLLEAREGDLVTELQGSKRLHGHILTQSGIQLLLRTLLAYALYSRRVLVLQSTLYVYPLAMYCLDLRLTVDDDDDNAPSKDFHTFNVRDVLEAIVFFPVGDHIHDHRALFLLPDDFMDNGLFLLFYAGHVYFLLLLKKRVDCLREEEEEEEQERKCRRRPWKRRQRVGQRLERKNEPSADAPTRCPDHSWFFHACLHGHKEIIKNILKDPDFDVNSKCVVSDNNSGLHIAVLSGELSVVQILLDNQHHRVDLLEQNGEGKSALELAVEMGRLDMVNKITSAKGFKWKWVNVNKLLHLAVQNGRHLVAQKIMQSPRFDDSDNYVVACIERWVELSEEMHGGEARVNNTRRQEDIEKSLTTYKAFICQRLSERLLSSSSVAAIHSSKRVRQMVEDYFECPVCSEEMVGEDVNIFTCSNDHWICSGCLQDDRLISCPICREDFQTLQPTRCLQAERIASQIQL